MPELVLVLPFPPTVNQYWRKVGQKMVLSQKANCFHAKANAEIKLQLWQLERRHAPFSDSLGVDITLHAPDCRKRDLDNYLKAAFDTLTHAGVWLDDSLVRELHMAWGHNCRGGKMEMRIWRLDEREF